MFSWMDDNHTCNDCWEEWEWPPEEWWAWPVLPDPPFLCLCGLGGGGLCWCWRHSLWSLDKLSFRKVLSSLRRLVRLVLIFLGSIRRFLSATPPMWAESDSARGRQISLASESDTKVGNIWFLSPLVLSKWEDLAFSVYIKVCLFFNFWMLKCSIMANKTQLWILSLKNWKKHNFLKKYKN